MPRVLAVSEYYNEAKNIPGLVENLASQTQVPDLMLIIDDGSVDNSTELYEEGLKQHGIPYKHYSMPPKAKPTANLKGRAFSKVDILNNEWLEQNAFDYLMLIGADTRFPRTYIEMCTKIMDKFPRFGTMAGRIHGEPGMDSPMGTGKIVRWNVVKETRGRYWDLDPDSLWNLIAIEMGLDMLILKDLLVTVTRPTHVYSPRGLFNYGRRMYYAGWGFATALLYTAVLSTRRGHPQHFLRGYLQAYTEHDWKCNDPEVVDYYSLKRMIRRALGISHQRDSATIVGLNINSVIENQLSQEFLSQSFLVISKAIARRFKDSNS